MVAAAECGHQQDPGENRGDDHEDGEAAPTEAVRTTHRARSPTLVAGRRHRRDRTGLVTAHQPPTVACGATPCTIDPMSAPAAPPPPRILIPRWIQLVGLPV